MNKGRRILEIAAVLFSGDTGFCSGAARMEPELRKYLAQNPNCYAELIEWLANLDDPQINEALQKRRAEQGQDSTL